MQETIVEAGIEYSLPTVVLLQESGIGVSEVAARTCYDSLDNSENRAITELDMFFDEDGADFTSQKFRWIANRVNSIDDSSLLDDLAWTYFHHSILEHANLSFLIRGTSRGVLQEHARHRVQAISVRSTRYTMSDIINAFVASAFIDGIKPSVNFFVDTILSLDMFVTASDEYNRIEAISMFEKLLLQYKILGRDEFINICLSKSNKEMFYNYKENEIYLKKIYQALQNGKKKKNVGDSFKHIVTDNWKVDMVVTFNLRSLKNYFTLRDSGAAFFQIRELAKAMKKVTPKKYLDLIVKVSNEYR
jgi:thymidylate synthase (FAD)